MAEQANAKRPTPNARRPIVELAHFADFVAIVVSSCDAFFDAWRPFTVFLRKFWADCPFEVYLITNELRAHSEVLKPISVGPDRGWASNLKRALHEIPTSHVLYLQEDYFLKSPVGRERMADDFSYAFENDIHSFCFRARTSLEPGFSPLNGRFGIVPSDSDGRTRCQATLWKREALISILRDGETAWDFEARGSQRTRDMQVLSYSNREAAPIQYVMSAISRGLWMPEALQLCHQHDVQLMERVRPVYSSNKLVQRFRRARGRRALSRELAKRRGTVIELDQA